MLKPYISIYKLTSYDKLLHTNMNHIWGSCCGILVDIFIRIRTAIYFLDYQKYFLDYQKYFLDYQKYFYQKYVCYTLLTWFLIGH